MSSAAFSSSAAVWGKRARRPSATLCNCVSALACSGCAKVVRTIAATASRMPCGTRAIRFRMKWTRQRCQAAPLRTVPIACFRPSWASEMTNRTPLSPRFTRHVSPRPRVPSPALTSVTCAPFSTCRPYRDELGLESPALSRECCGLLRSLGNLQELTAGRRLTEPFRPPRLRKRGRAEVRLL